MTAFLQNSEREPRSAIRFCTTSEGQCSQRMKHILLTQWGIKNLFLLVLCKNRSLSSKRHTGEKNNALICLALPFNYESNQPSPTWPCSVTSASNDQYRGLNLAHSTLSQLAGTSLRSHLHHCTEHIWVHLKSYANWKWCWKY